MESHEECGLSNLYQWETQRNASTHSKCKQSLILIFNLLPFEKRPIKTNPAQYFIVSDSKPHRWGINW